MWQRQIWSICLCMCEVAYLSFLEVIRNNEVIVYPRPVIGSLAHSIDYSCYLKQLQPGDDFSLIKPWFLLEQPLGKKVTSTLSIIHSDLQGVGVIFRILLRWQH